MNEKTKEQENSVVHDRGMMDQLGTTLLGERVAFRICRSRGCHVHCAGCGCIECIGGWCCSCLSCRSWCSCCCCGSILGKRISIDAFNHICECLLYVVSRFGRCIDVEDIQFCGQCDSLLFGHGARRLGTQIGLVANLNRTWTWTWTWAWTWTTCNTHPHKIDDVHTHANAHAHVHSLCPLCCAGSASASLVCYHHQNDIPIGMILELTQPTRNVV